MTTRAPHPDRDSHRAPPASHARAHREAPAETRPPRDLTLYGRLISDGIAAANNRGGAIDRSKAARLRGYVVACGTDLGPVGTDFAATCDQFDQADAMLAGLRERTRCDLDSPAITLVLDTTTANIVMHATAAHADDREAHVREVQQYGRKLPAASYGRRNRQAIAAREARIAARLRAVEQAYRTAIEHGAAYSRPDSTETRRTPERPLGRKTELQAEP